MKVMIYDQKKIYIQILQKNNSWGKNDLELEKEAEKIFDLIDFEDINNVDELKKIFKSKPQTNILINTHEVKSPINIDYQIELPIIELFIDRDNFVVFTTEGIFNSRNGIIRKIKYKNIECVDGNSINNALRDSSKRPHLFDIQLIMKSGESIPITVEYGISFRPIISFLATVNNASFWS